MISNLTTFGRERRGELLALGLLFAGVALLPLLSSRNVPMGIYGRGMVSAASLLLHAAGIILIFRANRFINFAQIQLGALGGAMFALLVQGRGFFRAAEAICPPCLATEPPAWALHLNYVIAAIIGIGVAVVLGGLMYQAVIRRLAASSQVVLTVASLFVLSLLAGLTDPLTERLTTERQRAAGIPGGSLPPPGDISVQLGGANFTTPDFILVVGALGGIIAIAAYLRFTSAGTATRAAATSRDRAQTLGIPVHRVSVRIWFIAGLLSGIAAIASVMSGGIESVAGDYSVASLVRVLAVVTVARMTSLSMAGLAAVAFGLLDQVVLTTMGSTRPLDGALLILIAGLLLAQRRQADRADRDLLGNWTTVGELRPIPRVLRSLPEVRRYLAVGSTVGAMILLGLPWVMSPSQTNLIATAMIYALVGLSLLVLTGWTGLVSLGQFAFAGIAGWAIAVLALPLPLALVVGPVVGAAVAFLVGLPALKLDGLYLAVSTLALGLATTAIVLSPQYLGSLLPDELDRPVILGFDLDDQRVAYYLALVILVLATIGVSHLRRSRTGRVLIASRDNAAAVSSVGVSVTRARMTSFVVSGALAALAGVLFTYQQAGVRPDAFTAELSVTLFVTTVIGGFGSVAGPLLGFSYFAIVSLFSSTPGVLQITSGLGGLVLLLALPGGLAQLAWSLRDAALRRVAVRRRLVVPSLIADGRVDGTEQLAPLRPRRASDGGDFVPRRYGLSGQWLVAPPPALPPSRPDDDISVPTLTDEPPVATDQQEASHV